MVLLAWELISALDSEVGGSSLLTTPYHPLSREQTSTLSVPSSVVGFSHVPLVLRLKLGPKGESVFKRREECLSEFWVISWFISEDETERRFMRRRMSCRVVREFGHWNEIRPLIGLSLAEHPKVHVHLLIDPFSFSVCLWMICSG